MEAASARMAARDRYGGFNEPATTPLQRFIQNACDPQNFEPNLALDLEIADVINSKKGNAPREAAVAIVSHINNRNPNISLLALTLLDICVKNCGYPFQLQISTKEFLNELVRRFPERPPMRYSRVQNKILECIEEWRSTICQTSKYKEDLGFIRDMHRLLSYKGYSFPAVKREDAAVLNPSDNLRSAEEMEEEERAAQSAKLQELIRRGTPHDLQEANRLMKVMAGFDNRHKTDYRAKAAEEVSKIQQKARLLEEMLQSYQADDAATNEGAEDLANSLASAQPKIQKMCEEESEDTEAVAKLFEINDSIHRTLERYRLTRKGDVEAASRIPKGTLGTSGAGVSKGPGNELSLIDLGPADFGGFEDASAQGTSTSTAPGGQQSSLENDLLGLSLAGEAQSAGGQISLGGGPPASSQPTGASSAAAKANIMNSFNMPPQSSFGQPQSQPFFTAPPPKHSAPPAYAPSQPPASQQQSQPPPPHPSIAAHQQSQATPQAPTQPILDPFAALSGPSARTSSPFQYQQSIRPPPSSTAPTQTTGSNRPNNGVPATHNTGAADDDWTFTSALPDQAHEIALTQSSVHISFLVSRPPATSNEILVASSVSNNTAEPVKDFTFQAAVMKSITIKMEPQSSRQLNPHQRGGIAQTIRLYGVQPGSGTAVKVRWKASYYVGSERKEEQGEVVGLGVA